MKKALGREWPGTGVFKTGMLCLLPALLLAGGCGTVTIPGMATGPEYKPTNIHLKSPVLPADFRRVAVLPLATASDSPLLEAGVDALTPILTTELEKTKRFEVVVLSTEQMKQLTGQGVWKTEDALPPDFFTRLRASTSCDGVMFSQITRYQAYQPLMVGWKLTLVDKTGAEILWSADEVFDAGNPEVANGARAYYTQHIHGEAPLSDSGTILRAPSQFGEYSVSLLFSTLPDR